MNYTAHPRLINDGEVSFKEKQYLLPKYQKIARDNIGALDTAQVLELIKEHGGGGEVGELEYLTAHDSSTYWKNYTSTSLITKMLTVDQSKGDSISLYKEESGYTALYLNKGLYYLHCEIEYHNSPDMTGFFNASTWGGAGYPFEYRTSEMLDLSKSVSHIAPFDAVILIDRDHKYLSLSNNFRSDDGSMYRFINRLQIYKLPIGTIEGGGSSETKYDLWSGSQVIIGSNAIVSSGGVSLQLTNIPAGVTTFKRLVIRTRYKNGASQYCPTFEPIILNDMPVVTGTQYRPAILATSACSTVLSTVSDGIDWKLEFKTTSRGELHCMCNGGIASDSFYGVSRVSSDSAALPSDYCCIYSVEGYV